MNILLGIHFVERAERKRDSRDAEHSARAEGGCDVEMARWWDGGMAGWRSVGREGYGEAIRGKLSASVVAE